MKVEKTTICHKKKSCLNETKFKADIDLKEKKWQQSLKWMELRRSFTTGFLRQSYEINLVLNFLTMPYLNLDHDNTVF